MNVFPHTIHGIAAQQCCSQNSFKAVMMSIKFLGMRWEQHGFYNPQNHLAADNKTTCLIFPLKQKTKRLKKRSKQHTKSVIQMLFKSHLNNTFYI